jgi:hypothetical protein
MSFAQHKPATYADLEAAPEHSTAEIFFGRLMAQSMEIFSLSEEVWKLTGALFNDENVCAPPFEQLTFSCALLWPAAAGQATQSKHST